MTENYALLWSEFSLLLRGLKEMSAHALSESGVRCEQSGALILTRLELLGPVRLTILAQALGLDPSSVSRQVSALERAGWLAREPDPADMRAQRLTLTPGGREVVSVVHRARQDALERLTPDWSPKDLNDLTSQLARLNHDLEANRHLLCARQESVS